MNMNVLEVDGGITHVLLDGRLDIMGAQEIDLKFNILAGSKNKLVIDLEKVSFLASMGVRTLMVGAKTVTRKGGRMVVCGADENVDKVLRMTGFDEVVTICPDFPAALAALSG